MGVITIVLNLSKLFERTLILGISDYHFVDALLTKKDLFSSVDSAILRLETHEPSLAHRRTGLRHSSMFLHCFTYSNSYIRCWDLVKEVDENERGNFSAFSKCSGGIAYGTKRHGVKTIFRG